MRSSNGRPKDEKDALRVALAPRSIALIGASENPNKICGRPRAYRARFRRATPLGRRSHRGRCPRRRAAPS